MQQNLNFKFKKITLNINLLKIILIKNFRRSSIKIKNLKQF